LTKITETLPIKKYVGNGTAKSFPFGFMYWNNEEIIVQLNGVKQTSGYAITSEDVTRGGTVTFATAPKTGVKIIIRRIIENKRYSEFEESGLFRANVANDELNRIVAQIQQLEETAERCVKVDVNDDNTPEELLTEVYNKLDSASAIAADARTAANAATTAANAATTAASQAVSIITSAVNTATASINQTVSSSEASIQQTINGAITNVTQAATSAAQEVIDNAAELVTNTAKTNLNTFLTAEVNPSLQNSVNAAASSATKAANTAAQFTTAYNQKLEEFNTNATVKQEAVDASAANAAASAAAAANSASAAASSKTNAATSEMNAADSAEIARKFAVGSINEEKAGSAKYWAEEVRKIYNKTDVLAQSIYQERVILESGVILLHERKCRYYREPAENEAFSIDISNINQPDMDITVDLILKMTSAVPIDLSAILPTGKWLDDNVPDFSDPGEYWIAFISDDGGVTWRGSYEGMFAL